ncbi:hypothetical protein [Parvibaculum sp.]|jgi:hypothetical protein|uniref:hypothetical protein n=1 Tax=Parvibaculum sp. TaxID=2024848 RepID=UPI0032994715
MSIKSHAFGRVTLTDEDAKKFKNQVIYGKPKAAAVESVKRGVTLAHEFGKGGRIRIQIDRAKVKGA